MMGSDLSILSGVVGYDQKYSLSEFNEYLNVDLSSKECKRGWVFWRPPEPLDYELAAAAAVDEELDSGISPPFDFPISNSFSRREIKDKIKCLLEKMISSYSGERKYLVQFWAPEVVEQNLYLTTGHQPFALGSLLKGFSWYRERCMGHRYRVDEGATEEELGAVGRVYRNKHPESTPDLRLYSIEEFPLRDDAARYGLRSFLALPVFDLSKEKCYGVIEVLFLDFKGMRAYPLEDGLEAAKLRTTHFNLDTFDWDRDADREIAKMLELAIRIMPQLQMAQVWVPCQECSKTSDNLSCMERATYITAEDGKVNIWTILDNDMCNYLEACSIHNLQVGKYKNMIAAVMSSNNRSCICRNICDFSISDNPLAHYAQKARLAFCFAICLESLYDSRDIYVVEFFLPFNSREDAFTGYFLPLLLRTIEMELKNFDFDYEGPPVDGLVIEVCRGIKLSSGESSRSNALRHESIKYKHQHSEELSMLIVTKGLKKRFPLLDFTKYLQKADLHCLQPSEKSRSGWVFWSQARGELSEDEVDSNSLLLPNPIQEKIKLLMREITSKSAAYSLAQFWAPKVDVDRSYLETSGQPFAFGSLYKGLAYFRKQCMEHYYFVDEAAKEEELGPPGRVFLNGHPEFSPDMSLYSPTEFPLRNHAAHCCLRKYLALPLFDLNQHKCVGVLELVEFSNSALEVIGKALEAANLSSTHINFKPGLQGSHLASNNAECRQSALTEIQEARKLFEQIPQLYMVEVWLSYNECPSKSKTLSCMERVWATRNMKELDLPMCQIQHLEAGKGIIGPGRYEYLRSFLCLLLPIMKQKLKSFKVASGQELGEKLVVEVIEFSEVNEPASSEIDQPDKFPFTFKFVKSHHQKHSKHKQVQFALEESVTSVAQVEQCNSSAANLKEKDEARETHLNTNFKDLESHFGQKRKDAEKALGICESTLKRRCKDYNIERWPSSEKRKENPSLFMRESANESARDSQPNMGLSSSSNLPPPDMPLHQNTLPTDPKSSQHLIVQPKVDMVVIYVKYESKTIKFKLCHSAGMEKLVNEVALRLKLDVGSFELEYLDEINEKILLTCDADLELCLESLEAVGKPYIQVFVQSI